MPEYDVALTDVCKTFPGDTRAVIDFTAEIEHGEFVALLGPSGCGKTTILRMIGGLEEVTSGTIYLSGTDVTDLPPSQRDTAMMFQSFALFPHRTVFQNVEFSLKMRGQSSSERVKPVWDILDMIGMSDLGARFPRDLSGGQQQRVALARALISRPTVLLLDEPLGSLDFSLRQSMMVELKKIQQDFGMTFVMVTHSQQEALSMADKVIVMSDAVIQQIGTSREVYEKPNTKFVANFIGNNNLFSGIVKSRSGSIVILQKDEQLFYVAEHGFTSSTPVDAEAYFCVRADKMHTNPQGDMANQISGRYIATEYVGSLETDVFELLDNHFVHVEQHRDAVKRDYRVGQQVQIYWSANEAVLLGNI
jgi:ABC-type Fe3+/spermidine/putrescine transport system ATPase subunit